MVHQTIPEEILEGRGRRRQARGLQNPLRSAYQSVLSHGAGDPFLAEEMYRPKRLTKSDDKVLAGVCGGVADFLGLDRSLVRVLVALVIFFSGIVTGLIVYLVAALVLPEADAA